MLAHYRIDKNNRLVIRKKGKALPVNGNFSVDSKNRLVYCLNEISAWRRKYHLPGKIVFYGTWKLNANYDLELELQQGRVKTEQEPLVIKAEIISAQADKLVFEVKSVDNNGLLKLRVIQLTGVWQADNLNQLSFAVGKTVNPDTLTLKGAWQLNKNQQITYTYQRTELKTKSKSSSVITFSGFWQIAVKDRLSYILSTGTKSRFDFKVQFETPTVYPQKGVIKYRIGVGLKERRPDKERVFSLYGTWKINRRIGLIFEIEYAHGEIYAMEFAAEVRLYQNNQVTFALKNKRGEDLGITIVFTHKLLKQLDAELFLRLKYSQKEQGIGLGLRLPF